MNKKQVKVTKNKHFIVTYKILSITEKLVIEVSGKSIKEVKDRFLRIFKEYSLLSVKNK
jgi:hypothetical protein